MIKSTLLTGLAITSPALGVKTEFFTQSGRTDFEAGTLESLVVTNFGELKLARAVENILAADGKYASIDAIAQGLDGTLYVGTNASGLLLSIRDGKPEQLADFGEAASVSALYVAPSGDVLVGVSGETAKLMMLKTGAPAPELIAELADTQYIWGIALAADGKIYLATGPSGQLFEVDPASKRAKVIFDSEEDNLRTIVSMNDMLFVGTDPNGLVLKVDRRSGKATVVFDAPESEVSTLLLDPRNGHVYAGTSQLVEASEDSPPADTAGHPPEHAARESLFIEPSETPKPKPSEDERNGELQSAHQPPAPKADEEESAEAPMTQPSTHGSSAAGPITSVGGEEPAPDGNAVYRIDSQGFVSEIFRDNSMVLAMSRIENQLLIASGPRGVLYQLDLSSEEHTAIAKTRSQMLTSILIAADKSIFVGSGLPATLSRLSAGLAKVGTFTSAVLDASRVSAFGKAQIRGAISPETAVTFSTRSGNVGNEESPLWSEWSEPVPAARFTEISTPPGRYLQFRIALSGDGSATPTLEEVSVAYQQPNVAPRIDSVTVTPVASEEGDPQPLRTISWTATEPNGDDLRYAIYQRMGAGSPWVQLAKDLTDVTWEWDTRKLADGRYEVKVEASDALANAVGSGKTVSRVAKAVQVDNTPPAIGDLKLTREGGNITISLRVADRGGVISGLEYSLDVDEHWQTVPASDMLNDSPDEQYSIVLPDPGAATRVVSLRSRDESGNTAYESVTIRPESK